MDKESESMRCSFCQRPRRLIFALQVGPEGNICDLCALEAYQGSGVKGSSWKRCSFCGKTEGIVVKLASKSAAICANCARDYHERLLQSLPPEEFLLESPRTDVERKMAELAALLRDFSGDLVKFNRYFDCGEIDWNAHNEMAKKIPAMKGKAGILRLTEVSDLLWELESAFQGIHFDDIDSNRKGVKALTEVFAKLVSAVKSGPGTA